MVLDSPPRLPGTGLYERSPAPVKTRTQQKARLVPHTVNGQTELVLERYTVEVPVPPRDWDRVVLAGVTAIAALLLAACVVWSTANVGDLLSRVAVAPAAYGAAIAFDLAWIVFMAVEWVARYDPPRAVLPRRAGHFALLVAMVAVGAHGWLVGQAAVGVISAIVSGIVKTVWTVVLCHHAKPLDDKTQQWVDIQRAAAGGELAMIAVDRELMRARAQVEAEQVALRAAVRTGPEDSGPDPEDSGRGPDSVDQQALPSMSGPMTITDAVRTAVDSGITDPDAIFRYVRKVADANAKPETVARYFRAVRKGA